jgi:hypothetical protein
MTDTDELAEKLLAGLDGVPDGPWEAMTPGLIDFISNVTLFHIAIGLLPVGLAWLWNEVN